MGCCSTVAVLVVPSFNNLTPWRASPPAVSPLQRALWRMRATDSRRAYRRCGGAGGRQAPHAPVPAAGQHLHFQRDQWNRRRLAGIAPRTPAILQAAAGKRGSGRQVGAKAAGSHRRKAPDLALLWPSLTTPLREIVGGGCCSCAVQLPRPAGACHSHAVPSASTCSTSACSRRGFRVMTLVPAT